MTTTGCFTVATEADVALSPSLLSDQGKPPKTPRASSGAWRGPTEQLVPNSSTLGVSSPSVLESLMLRAGGGCARGWDADPLCQALCRSPVPGLASLPWAGHAGSPQGSPRTRAAHSGRPSFGHSSPASGSWSAALSGSPAPWCSPAGGGRGCQGSALARWKLSARTQDRHSVSAQPEESLSPPPLPSQDHAPVAHPAGDSQKPW